MLDDRVILKEGRVFLVCDPKGDVTQGDVEGLGLWYSDTRFLSRFELRLCGSEPIELDHSVDRAYVAAFQLVNSNLDGIDGPPIDKQSISIRRTRFLRRGLHERVAVQNCNIFKVRLEITLTFDVDFNDLFEVRGIREALTRDIARETTETGFIFSYLGQDQVRRETEVIFQPMPTLAGTTATYSLELEPQATFDLIVDVLPTLGDETPHESFAFDIALETLERSYAQWRDSSSDLSTDNQLFDRGLLWRSLEDLRILCDEWPSGLFPTAGVPWYAVPFGRDALVTSLQTLALNPDVARGTLRFLADHQGRQTDAFREEDPGKILHEMRFGELASLGLIPHTPYYGSVDSTPLFLVLLVELVNWTGDVDMLSHLTPNIFAALEWIDTYGDPDGDGFLEYGAENSPTLRNQGWKDSEDSLVDASGHLPNMPVSIIEVQGYVYQAKMGLANIFGRLGMRDQAVRLAEQARKLQRRFEESYWMPNLHFYAQALDRDKRQLPSISSNPGHALWSGIASPKHAAQVVSRLMEPDMFSGWGIRTLSTQAVNYNPMSYHNGTVWPHDNSLIASGFRRYGHREEAECVARSVLEAGSRFGDSRLPELFCGFERDRRFSQGPCEYLVSCSPQAWATGSVFHLLQTLAGVEVDALAGKIHIDPLATSLYSRLRVEGMRVGEGLLDFTIDNRKVGPRVKVDRKPVGMVVHTPA